jgi:hypothetical protein
MAGRFSRILLAVLIGTSLLGFYPSPVQADTVPIDLVLGGSGATPWVLSNIEPGSGGIETVELHNAGSKDGFVTIWISDIISGEGSNPEAETVYTAEPGELADNVLFNIAADGLVTDMDLPTILNNFPGSYDSGNSIELIPLRSGGTVNLQWSWELPAGTGNDVQGDDMSFTINYLLRECKVTDVSGLVTGTGSFTETVIVESDTAKGKITISENVTGHTNAGQPLTEIWLIEMDKQPPAEPGGDRVISLWDIGPDGITFDEPVTLTLSYRDPEDIPQGVNEKDLTISLWDNDAGKWVELDSTVDTISNIISAQVSHFSRYAIEGIVSHPSPTPPAPNEVHPGPKPPVVESPPTAYLDTNLLGRERTVEIGIDGTLIKPLTLSDSLGKFVLQFEKGSQIVGDNATLLERLELVEEVGSIVLLTGVALPDNIVLLSPIYRLTGYADSSQVEPVFFKPSAILSISYATEDLPQNISTPFIACLTKDEGIVPIEAPAGSLVEIGKAKGKIDHASLFVVAARVLPPPAPLPTDFSLSNLVINPRVSDINEPVTISADLGNKGKSAGVYELYLQIDGIVKDIEKITLGPGESRTVTFRVSELAGGVHKVRIGDLKGSFEIRTTVTVPAEASVNWLPLDIGIGVLILSGLVGLFVFRRRKQR